MAKVCYNALKKLHTFMFQSTLDIGLTERIQKYKHQSVLILFLKYTLNYVVRNFLKLLDTIVRYPRVIAYFSYLLDK